MSERLVRPLELRAESRTLIGTALRYGDVSPSHKERFVPGAFGDLSGVKWLDYRHDPTRVVAHTGDGSLKLSDSPEALTLRAELPALPLSDLVLKEIQDGTLSGLSIEFRSIDERTSNDLRVVERASLVGVGLVATPSYPESKVETRQAGLLFAKIPYEKELACECYRGSGNCNTVSFEPGAVEFVDEENLIATFKSFATPLASVSKGTLRYEAVDDGLEIYLDIPDTSWGRDLVETAESVPVVARPLFDADEVEATEVEIDGEKVAKLSKVPTRAILIGSTPNGKGWPEVEITPAKRRLSRRERYPWL
ncbi:hypothetical protein F4X33_11350 [Candidatus Poribacteria bacterium]|nr:hypothetical protein [Candidatus Poribacteria bacterium]